MTNFRGLTPLEAVKWFDENRNALGLTEAVQTVERLLALDITDTAQMLEFAAGTVLDDLEAVPGLAPTPDNLRQLAIVGPTVLASDPDNVADWIKIAQDFAEEGEDPASILEPFLTAGRGPTFAHQVLDLIARTNADATNHRKPAWTTWGNTSRSRRYWDITDFDLTQPYSVLADMAAAGLDEHERAQWAAAGYDLADAIKLRGDGLDLVRIDVLKHHGVPSERWIEYVRIPIDWVNADAYYDKGKGVRELPEGITLDLLASLAAAGWQSHTVEVPGGRRRNGRYHPLVWQVYFGYGLVDLTADQLNRLRAAKLTNHDITGYYLEARSGAASRGDTKDQPPPLILKAPTDDQLDEFITTVLKLAAAKVRKSHLSTYRWVGCHTFELILEAAAAGISEPRAKQLRANYGRKAGWGSNAPRRIDSLASLLEFDRKDREPAGAQQ